MAILRSRKFKVGDAVVVVNTGNIAGFHVGKVVRVTATDAYDNIIDIDDMNAKTPWGQRLWQFDNSWFFPTPSASITSPTPSASITSPAPMIFKSSSVGATPYFTVNTTSPAPAFVTGNFVPTPKSQELKVGDNIHMWSGGGQDEGTEDEGTGVVTHISADGDHAEVTKDKDGYTGWEIRKRDDGTWGGDNDRGYIEIMKKKKAKKIKVDTKKLDPLIIDAGTKNEIIAVLKQHQNHDKIFTKWGLGSVIEYGKGMTFMFYGPPGTGKTWGAHCIAKALGLELLVLAAADIQSSEPGGANRAITAAFKEAKNKNKVLFIDECDSLIRNRAELGMILSSEVNTLLTEIEKFEGVLILATNMVQNMDAALERRISLIVKFVEPDLDMRKQIWKTLLPKKLPLHKDVSAATLAEHELTGGMIKNVLLAAARLASASNARTLTLEHFEQAIKRIKASAGLMGTNHAHVHAHSHGEDSEVGVDTTKTLDTFLEVDEDKP